MAVIPNMGQVPGNTVPTNLSGGGANLSLDLPAFQPVPPSASYNAMLSSLQGQPSLQGFLPSPGSSSNGGGAGSPPGGVATPGGGTSGAPALPALTSPHTPTTRFFGNSSNTNYQGATPTGPGYGGGIRFPGQLPSSSVPGGPFPAGGLQGLFASLLGAFQGNGGGFQQPAGPPVVPPPTPPTAQLPQSPWASLAQYFRNPSGGPVGQQ